MSDWSNDLSSALAGGDPALMTAMLSRVPKEVLQRAIPYLEKMAKNSVNEGKLDEALTFYSQLVDVQTENADWRAKRAEVYFKLDRLTEAMEDANRIIDLQPKRPLGYRLRAEAHDGLRERPQAIAAFKEVLSLEPNDEQSKRRIQFLENEVRKEALLKQTLNPETANEPLHIEMPPLPTVEFDPKLFDNPAIDDSFGKAMLDGLKQLLWRYSAHQSPKNILARLEDPEWMRAWDAALGATSKLAVRFHGSELGVFALRARHHGAKPIFDVESFPLDGRIASGVVQKNLIADWHRLHGAAIQSWPEDERRVSFESIAKDITIVSPNSSELDNSKCDYFVFPSIDHSLLGTGIVKAVRRLRSQFPAERIKVLPAGAKVFAMPIQWRDEACTFKLEPMNEFRWNFYPETLGMADNQWTALSNAIQIGTIDFENFQETRWEIAFEIITPGRVDAVAYWFELDLGITHIANPPGGLLKCIKPAVQYCDSIPVASGQQLHVSVYVHESRLQIETQPATNKSRVHRLPDWYIPMLLDETRNEAYRTALKNTLEAEPARAVLDIGAGCGLLSMMAAQLGAEHVFACEVSPALSKVSKEIVELNGLDRTVTIIHKDCRKIVIPDDLPTRADLAVFELFDCSLIGEGVLHFIAHAREHLLEANARYVPLKGRIRAAIIEFRVDHVLGVDVNLLNPYRFSPSFINVQANTLNYRALTESFDVFSFDFATATPTPEEKELLIPSLSDGIAGAMLFWFDLQLDETTWLSNDPTASAQSHWKQGLQFLPEVNVRSGLTMPIVAKHNGSSLTFQWKQDGLPKETFSLLPRFDPRWWQQNKELEHQTQGLLQHCMHNPEEYKMVAELAKRFAIDPGSHDLDSAVAQRLAMVFFGA